MRLTLKISAKFIPLCLSLGLGFAVSIAFFATMAAALSDSIAGNWQGQIEQPGCSRGKRSAVSVKPIKLRINENATELLNSQPVITIDEMEFLGPITAVQQDALKGPFVHGGKDVIETTTVQVNLKTEGDLIVGFRLAGTVDGLSKCGPAKVSLTRR